MQDICFNGLHLFIFTSKFAFNTFLGFLIFPFLISCGLGASFCGVLGCDAVEMKRKFIQQN